MVDMLRGAESYAIAAGDLWARFCPGMGGRLLGFGVRGGADVLVAGEAHDFETTNWPRAGAYPLIPYHNRLADAAVVVDGATTRLRPHPAALPHTLHGPAHARPWVAGAHDGRSFSMSLDYTADQDWPWNFRAQQRFEIGETGLRLELTLENRDDRPMPAGLGWHPYFASRHPVASDAQHLWPHETDYLPNGSRLPFSGGDGKIEVPTAYLENWTTAEIDLADSIRVTMTASPLFRFLVVHRGDPAHICVEPVSHVANAWNLPLSSTRTGATVLAPGQTLQGTVELSVSRKTAR